MHSSGRRRPGRCGALVVLAVVVIVLASGSGAGVLAFTSVRDQASQLQAQLTVHLQAGQTGLEAAKTNLKLANSTHDQGQIVQAYVHFNAAKVEFMVSRQTADSSQLLQRLEAVPDVGAMARSRHVAVDAIADMGVAISDAGLELTKLDGQLIKPSTGGGPQGRTLLTVLEQTNTSLVIVRRHLELARKAAARVDIGVLPAGQQASFVKARATITSALAAADEFSRLVPIVTELLGGNGARTYLVEQVNPAELRPGGGFIGTYSVLRADHGNLGVVRSGNATELINLPRPLEGERGYVPAPGPLQEFVPGVSWTFIDSNFFPDFPSNAQAGETFAQPFVGHLDGVISMDFYTVAKMLEVTGPLPVAGYGITLTSTNFVPLVVESDLAATDATHKALLAAAAGPLMSRISALPPDRWPALITALNDLAASRHLQAYFNNPSVEEIGQFGWSGALNPTGAANYMMSVESNLGGTKANYFVVRHFTIELTRAAITVHHKVTIDITDNMPYAYRPSEYYSAYLRLYTHASSSTGFANLRRARYPNPGPPPGTKMIDGWLPTFHGYGHSAQVVWEYDTPWIGNGRGEETMYWQKQPGTLNDKIDVQWNDGKGHTYTATGDLAQDRVITLSTRGVTISAGQPAQAKLPSLSLG